MYNFKSFQGLLVKILKALLPSSILATWPAHLDLLTMLGERYKLWSSSVWSLLHFPFSTFMGPNVHLRIPFSNTLNLRSSLNVRDHVSQPYSTTSNIIVLYILIIKIRRGNSRIQECLDWIITWISCFESTFYFLLNINLYLSIKSLSILRFSLFHRNYYLPILICSFAIMPQLRPISMYLVFPVLTAKPCIKNKMQCSNILMISWK